MKRALVIRHVAHEGIAGYRAPLEAAGYAIQGAAACEPCLAKVDPLAPDLLIVMGGPMGVDERAAHPWLCREIDLIARRLAAGLPTLGVSLGAQFIAAALRALMRKGSAREIGFAPVALTSAEWGRAARGTRRRAGAALAWRHVRPTDRRAIAGAHRFVSSGIRRG